MTEHTQPPDRYAPLLLDNQLCFGLYAAANAIIRAYRPMLSEIGVTYPQYLVLMALWAKDCRTVSELGRELMLDSGTLTPLLKRMESSGLINRRRRARDEREVEIALTEQGRGLRDTALDVRAEIVRQLTLCESDIGRLRSDLNRVLNALQDSGERTRKLVSDTV